MSPSPAAPAAHPWLDELLFDVERADLGARDEAGAAIATARLGLRRGLVAAERGEVLGVDLVHGLVDQLLAQGAFARTADLQIHVSCSTEPPVAAVAGALRAFAGHGVALRRVTVVDAATVDVVATLAGPVVAALRSPVVGDRIVALCGCGIGDAEVPWQQRVTRGGAPDASPLPAQKSHGSVLHHPLRSGWCGAVAIVGADLVTSMRRVLPRDADAELAGSLPSADAHRSLLPDVALDLAAAQCACGVGMLVFAAPQFADEIAAHVRLWNEPVAVIGELCPGSGRVRCQALHWAAS